MRMSYWTFASMIATSTLVMFALMYVHTYAWDHAYFSETRAWMALLMGAVMAVVMMGFMHGMYPSRAANAAILMTAVGVSVVAAWAVRSQATVTGVDYMQAMVPHHSIALLTSQRARIADSRVRKLADEIIESQQKEIAEMAFLIRALQAGVPPTVRPAESRPAMAPGEAARRADLAETDLETLTDSEVRRMLGDGPVCRFGFSRNGAVVAAATRTDAAVEGVIKLHGHLARMQGRYVRTAADGFELVGDDVRVTIARHEPLSTTDPVPADARLSIGGVLDAGYAGFYWCRQ